MGKYNYSIENTENIARGVGRALNISLKHAIEICAYIRGKSLKRSKAFLENVIEKKEAVPFRRFNDDVGHKPGVGPGRYPVKAATDILKMLKSVESNADEKGMDVNILVVSHTCANKASRPMRPGRHSRRESKRTHVEIGLKEDAKLSKKTDTKKKQSTKTQDNKKTTTKTTKKSTVAQAAKSNKSEEVKSDEDNKK